MVGVGRRSANSRNSASVALPTSCWTTDKMNLFPGWMGGLVFQHPLRALHFERYHFSQVQNLELLTRHHANSSNTFMNEPELCWPQGFMNPRKEERRETTRKRRMDEINGKKNDVKTIPHYCSAVSLSISKSITNR